MTLSAAQLIAGTLMVPLYALLGAAAYYLGSRATITHWLWSRYPERLDRFMLCAACSGFWYGVGAAMGIGWYLDVPFLVLPGRFWLTPCVVGLCSLVFTPWLSAKHLAALETTTGPPLSDPPAPEEGASDAEEARR